MKKNTAKFTIGLFVIGSLTLLFVTAMFLKAITLPTDNARFALFFNQSLKGLVVGSPVYFKGVTIGTVEAIHLTPLITDDTVSIPVIINIDNTFFEAIYATDEFGKSAKDPEEAMEILIEEGLQAGLTMVSFVSGQLAVQLDIDISRASDTIIEYQKYEGLVQIPTMLSSMDDLIKKAQGVPFTEISYELLTSLESLNAAIEDANIQDLSTNINGLVLELSHIGKDLNTVQANGLTSSQNVGALLVKANLTFDGINKNIDQILTNTNDLILNLNTMVGSTNMILSEDSAFVSEFTKSMEILQTTLSSVTNLVNLLEQNPSVLVFGK